MGRHAVSAPATDPTLLRAWLLRARKHPQAHRLILRGSLLTAALCQDGQSQDLPDLDTQHARAGTLLTARCPVDLD